MQPLAVTRSLAVPFVAVSCLVRLRVRKLEVAAAAEGTARSSGGPNEVKNLQNGRIDDK